MNAWLKNRRQIRRNNRQLKELLISTRVNNKRCFSVFIPYNDDNIGVCDCCGIKAKYVIAEGKYGWAWLYCGECRTK